MIDGVGGAWEGTGGDFNKVIRVGPMEKVTSEENLEGIARVCQ